jgi:hypothetical protein
MHQMLVLKAGFWFLRASTEKAPATWVHEIQLAICIQTADANNYLTLPDDVQNTIEGVEALLETLIHESHKFFALQMMNFPKCDMFYFKYCLLPVTI